MSLKQKISNFTKKEIDYTLIAGILGDGYFSGNWIYHAHTSKQKDYVLFKEYVFKLMGCETKTKYNYRVETNFGNYTYYSVAAKPKNVKRLKDKSVKYYTDRLTTLGLLLWWLDDGSLIVHTKKCGNSTSRFGYLNTHSFDYQQNKVMVKYFKDKYDIKLSIHKDTSTISDNTYYRLYFNATALRAMIDIVREWIEYIPESMLYKFDMKYFKNRHKDSEFFAKHYNFSTSSNKREMGGNL